MEKLALLIGTIVGVMIVCTFLALPLMLCWNYTMPDIFGLPEIGLIQALVLNILSGILFKPNKVKQ